MGQKFLADPAGHGAGYPVIGKNSEQFSYADPVFIDSNGWLTLIGTTDKVLGYYTGQGETMDGSNQTTGGKVKPDYVYAAGVEMVFGADQNCIQGDVGAYADMATVTTGAFELNLAAGGTGQFLVIGFDPTEDSTLTDVVVIAAEPQIFGFGQT